MKSILLIISSVAVLSALSAQSQNQPPAGNAGSPTAAPAQANPALQQRLDLRQPSQTNGAMATTPSTTQAFPAANTGATQTRTRAVADRAATAQDQIILRDIRTSITRRMAGFNLSTVHFIVEGGVVTLVGNVPSQEQSLEIEQACQGIPNVARIANNLIIGNTAAIGTTPTETPGQPLGTAGQSLGTTAPSAGTTAQSLGTAGTTALEDRAFTSEDQQLLNAVRKRVRDMTLPTPVHFVVQSGAVTLMGTVPEDTTERIENVVRLVPGVVQVDNQLQTIIGQPTQTGGATSPGGTSTGESSSGPENALHPTIPTQPQNQDTVPRQ